MSFFTGTMHIPFDIRDERDFFFKFPHALLVG
jgi:hypothetical protein